MRKRLSPERERLCREYTEKNWKDYKDNPLYPRSEEVKKENVLRGKITEFACKQDLEEWGVLVLPIHEGKGCDDGRDIKTPKASLNVKSVRSEKYDSGEHTKLLKNTWDKGDFYVMYKLYPSLEYEFLGFIDAKLAKTVNIVLLSQLNRNFEELILKLR
jgi:hypothetical protein